jgi:hypothetical protein
MLTRWFPKICGLICGSVLLSDMLVTRYCLSLKKFVELYSYLDLVLKTSANSGARLGQFLGAKTKTECSHSSCLAEQRTFDHF